MGTDSRSARRSGWSFIITVIAAALAIQCGGERNGGSEFTVLFDKLEPSRAALIILFLENNEVDVDVTMNDKLFSISVSPQIARQAKEYITGSVDSALCVELIRGGCFDETLPPETPPPLAEFFRRDPEGESNIPAIGEIFSTVFHEGSWRVWRSRDLTINVEFTGAVPDTIENREACLELLKYTTGNWEMLFVEVGPESSVWRFRWTVGIDKRSFKKESIRVIPGRFKERIDKPTGPIIYINF